MKTDPRLDNSNRKVIQKQETSSADLSIEEEPDDAEMDTEEIVQLKNLTQARREYGLNLYQLRMARKRKQLQRVQLGGAGRLYYLESELRALAEHLGLIPTHDGPGGAKTKMGWTRADQAA